MQCGYTEAAPFKSLNRANVEAGIITSKDYFNEAATILFERVSIVLALNVRPELGGGSAPADIKTYDSSTDTVDDAFLLRFNPQTVGGIILPRGCSVVSLDLRKTILRPGTERFPILQMRQRLQQPPLHVESDGGGVLLRHDFYGCGPLGPANKKSHHLMSVFEFAASRSSTTLHQDHQRLYEPWHLEHGHGNSP